MRRIIGRGVKLRTTVVSEHMAAASGSWLERYVRNWTAAVAHAHLCLQLGGQGDERHCRYHCLSRPAVRRLDR